MRMSAATVKKQDTELWLAKRFLSEFGAGRTSCVSLSDFVPAKAQHSAADLNNMMPDVVAANLGGQDVGLELTAYSDDDLKNQQGAFQKSARLAVRHVAVNFPSLQGCIVGYDSFETAKPPAGKISEFARQLLDCADRMLSARIVPGRTVDFPTIQQLSIEKPLGHWPLLDQYIYRVSVTASDGPLQIPVDGSTSFAHYYGTDVQKLADSIRTKEGKRQRKSFNGLTTLWLLIHAAREPMSSAITPLDAGEIRDLLASPAASEAKASGFDRVILWDYIWGGYVDLKSGMHKTYAKTT
jgi:hypothetical protein